MVTADTSTLVTLGELSPPLSLRARCSCWIFTLGPAAHAHCRSGLTTYAMRAPFSVCCGGKRPGCCMSLSPETILMPCEHLARRRVPCGPMDTSVRDPGRADGMHHDRLRRQLPPIFCGRQPRVRWAQDAERALLAGCSRADADVRAHAPRLAGALLDSHSAYELNCKAAATDTREPAMCALGRRCRARASG